MIFVSAVKKFTPKVSEEFKYVASKTAAYI